MDRLGKISTALNLAPLAIPTVTGLIVKKYTTITGLIIKQCVTVTGSIMKNYTAYCWSINGKQHKTMLKKMAVKIS